MLAFCVLTDADAINRLIRNSGDLQTVNAGADYQIRFTVGLQSPVRGSTYVNYAQTPTASVNLDVSSKRNKTTYYEDDYDPEDDNTARGYQNETQVYYDAAHNYDQENITIAVSDVGTIKKVGSHNVPADSGSGFTMYESTHNMYSTTMNPHQRLSGSVTLTLTAPAAGATGTITITPVTDPTTGELSPLVFNIYVVGPLNASGTTAVNTTNSDGVERVSDLRDTQINGDFSFTPGTTEPVYYEVEGSGRLYVSLPAARDRKTSPTNRLYTSSAAAVYLDTNGGSSKVTAHIAGSGNTAKILYIFSGGPTTTHPRIEVMSGDNQIGAPSGRLDEYFEVKVTDGRRRPMSGVPVTFTSSPTAMFIPVAGTSLYIATPTAASIDAVRPAITVATSTAPAPAATHHVQTDRSGVAKIYYQLSATTGSHTITAAAYGVTGLSAPLTATASTTARAGVANLEIVSGNGQSAEKGQFLEDDLVVIARSLAGHRIRDVVIQFRTTTGTLVPAAGTAQPVEADTFWSQGDPAANNPRNPTRGQQIYVKTGPNGQAGVTYNVGQLVVAREVDAEVRREAGDNQYDFAIDEVVFNINGGTSGTGTGGRGNLTPAAPNALNIAVSGSGNERTVRVTALQNTISQTGIFVTLSVTPSTATLSPISGPTPLTSTLTLPPATAGTYTLTATTAVTGYNPVTEPVEVTLPGTLGLSLIGSQVNGSQTVQVSVRNTAGSLETSPVLVTLTGAGISRTVTVTGYQDVPIVLPTAAGTLIASATGYNDGSVTLPARSTTTPTTTATPTTPTTPTVTAPEPDSIEISGPATRTGTVNTALSAPLLVRVLDDEDEGVEDARVTFRVRKGQGRLQQRGTGRAIAVRTDSRGYARADYTPLSANSTVEAETRGVTRTVTFTITTTGAATPVPTTPGTTGPSTTPIDPKILVGAGKRPAMVWVDNGMLYRLTGAEATKIAENVNDAAIGNGKVYWTSATGASSGTINSANLDGNPSVTTLATIMAVPMGIAVDTAGKKLYWTNSRGRVQSASLNGSSIRNVQQNLSDPTDLALSSTHIYYVESGDTIRRVNMTGTKVVKDVAVGLMDVGGIAVGGGKVYWTEKTGASAGTINGANPDGTQFKTLATIKAVPMGIAVDTAGKKLYWTNSRGRVQSGNLNGSSIRNVVDGLGTPSHLAISSASQGTTAAKPATQPAVQTPKKDTTAYDVNGDGTVDNTDASLVSEAMGTDNKKYDVNGDGTVNFFDLMLVFDNRDAEAAAAPTIVGMQLSSLQIAVIEEQIDLLIATGDRSPAAMRTLVYLQQLIATARPEKTQLLANYPNPFNPETWIPYELSTDTDVRITIYNAQGVVIRTLQLGQQSAGYYTDRQRAAYWDGRNALGEQVASGIYFYQLETDDMSSLRKMVILK